MRATIGTIWPAALVGLALGACSAIPTEPVRVNEGVADLTTCRRIGSLGEPVRADPGAAAVGLRGPVPGPQGTLDASIAGWRQAAVAAGATDILLTKRFYRDWSYVEPVGYVCRR